MASAASRKQGHLEAGKRKLEEFRQKKAAEKAKKASSTGHFHATDGVLHEKQPLETKHAPHTDFNGPVTPGAFDEVQVVPKDVLESATKASNLSLDTDFDSTDFNAKLSLLVSNNDTKSSAQVHSYLDNAEHKEDAASVGLDRFGSASDTLWNRKGDNGSSAQVSPWAGNNQSLDHCISSSEENHPSNHFDYHGLNNNPSNNINGGEKVLSRGNSDTTAILTKEILPQNSVTTPVADPLSNGGHGNQKLKFFPYTDSHHSTSSITDSAHGYGPKFSAFSDIRDQKVSGFADHVGSTYHSSPWTHENRYPDYDSDARSSSNRALPSPPASGRRSQPMFLDSIQIPKGSALFPPPLGAMKTEPPISKALPVDGLGSSVSQRSVNSSVASGDGVGPFNNVKENRNDFFSQKQKEDFAALEQHIEDLTQEKFSLQRALEASRALAESLASENSVLTESYNQQGAMVTQLKLDLEKSQEAIKVHLAELEAVKNEYANARMECNAADERAKLLASEVIGLEEKALRLRSNELKLERQLENFQAEISSYSKKLSSLEKDRQDLRSTIDALQEEKRLLESKLRKASGKSMDFNTIYTKKDASTSMDDLEINSFPEPAEPESAGNALLGDDASPSQLPHANINLSLEGQAMSFPSDQIGTIQNINTLLAELGLEKEQLMRALSEKSSQSSKLLELNKELTRKLEAQTQRLELLISHNMRNDNIQKRKLDSHIIHENETFADEGDEVVERVLGWIMKLFPGGPSRRQSL